MNIKTVVDGLKYRINGGAASQDSRLSESYLKHVVVAARNTLFRQKKDKGQSLPEYLYTYICTDVINSSFHNCNCAEGACSFKATAMTIPSHIDLEVTNLNGEIYNQMNLDTLKYKKKYSKSNAKTTQYEYKNNRVYFYDAHPNLSKAVIKIIASDEIKGIESCPTDSTGSGAGDGSSACTVKTSSLFIDDNYIKELYDIAESIIYGRLRQSINDISNNKQDNTQVSLER